MNLKPFLLYSLVGAVFGVIDWYGVVGLLRVVYKLSQGNQALELGAEAINWGVWLLPAVPVAWYEARRSRNATRSGLAVVTVWLAAVVAYYLYYAYLLAFVGLNQMEDLLVFGRRPTYFWSTWLSTLRSLIFGQMWEWGRVALVGGFLVGWVVGWVYLRWPRRNTRAESCRSA